MPRSPTPRTVVGPLLRASALGLLSLGALLGCRGSGSGGEAGLEMRVHLSPTPPAVGPASLLVEVRTAEGDPVVDARVVVEGNMSHAGMVPVIDTASLREPGRYTVPEFRLTMAGDWVLSVRATLPDGRWTEIDHPTRVVGGGGGERR